MDKEKLVIVFIKYVCTWTVERKCLADTGIMEDIGENLPLWNQLIFSGSLSDLPSL